MAILAVVELAAMVELAVVEIAVEMVELVVMELAVELTMAFAVAVAAVTVNLHQPQAVKFIKYKHFKNNRKHVKDHT